MELAGWLVYRGTRGQVHVIPGCDAILHDATRGCWCQPTQDPTDDVLFIHHSADGRELDEPDAYPPATRH